VLANGRNAISLPGLEQIPSGEIGLHYDERHGREPEAAVTGRHHHHHHYQPPPTHTEEEMWIVTYALWIVQALLALVFLLSGGMKLVLPLDVLTEQMPGLPGLFIRFIGAAETL